MFMEGLELGEQRSVKGWGYSCVFLYLSIFSEFQSQGLGRVHQCFILIQQNSVSSSPWSIHPLHFPEMQSIPTSGSTSVFGLSKPHSFRRVLSIYFLFLKIETFSSWDSSWRAPLCGCCLPELLSRFPCACGPGGDPHSQPHLGLLMRFRMP